ncbi:hypothetical protein [Streptomyces sp. NBC_01643]|uniref:hypothetical protein n=1 Tax=Streptomyces sp. NBC_01643 TaxID=2975906 RepID=UPI002F9142EF|nr:hypothetical protein OHB03_47645 [Streptomyces sp. NBC_01643]
MSAYQFPLQLGLGSRACWHRQPAPLRHPGLQRLSVLLATAFLSERFTRNTCLSSTIAISGSAVIALIGGPAGLTASA